MNSALYIKTPMEPHLVSFWHQCCETYGWIGIVEDGAPGEKGASNHYQRLNDMEQIR